MHSISHYQELISHYFSELHLTKEPENLYKPIEYILSLGGKRMRPILTLMTAEIFDVDCKKALAAATAIEVFHNFSLVHDDIMDDMPGIDDIGFNEFRVSQVPSGADRGS